MMKSAYGAIFATLLVAGCSIEIPEDPQPANPGVAFEPTATRPPEASGGAVQQQFSSVEEALSVLVKSSDTEDKQQQKAAYLWLARQGAAAVEPVVTTMNDESVSMVARRHACGVLGHLGPTATEALLDASRSDETALKLKAIESMPAIKPPSKPIVDRLIVLLDDPSDQVKNTAIRSLGQIGPPAKAAAEKLNALRGNSPSETTRLAAGDALKLVRPIRTFDD